MSSSNSSDSMAGNVMSEANNAIAVDTIVDFSNRRRDLDNCLEYEDDCNIAGAMIDVEGYCYADYRIEQYAQSVLDFSSQYGIDLSISYTAPNITGRPSMYPEYGDFPQTLQWFVK
ncbi:hypothetical protein EVAR_101461_1 [Eumeta japonica]|uniref:Uncharacterized protein n=1 Tax=Eumeta variegata TaxID=151549 RepID=A0A4C1TAZ5_EUMVA|nr:hypothetical protein EVAR_101461_1 [Eumeta japonica]